MADHDVAERRIALGGQTDPGSRLRSIKTLATNTLDQQLQRPLTVRDVREIGEVRDVSLELQTIVSTRDLAPVTTEALLRWQRADGGDIQPGILFPFVERHRLHAIVDKAVLRSACSVAAVRHTDVGIAVNVSAAWFRACEERLDAVIEQTLRVAELAPERLTLELTEQAAVENPLKALEQLRALKGFGVKLALDDFGVRHSSLARLAQYPFDVVKLDRSFIAKLGDNRKADDLVRGVGLLVNALGLVPCYEGVETLRQSDFIRDLGEGLMQGFYIDDLIG